MGTLSWGVGVGNSTLHAQPPSETLWPGARTGATPALPAVSLASVPPQGLLVHHRSTR